MAWIIANWGMIATALFAVSELLDAIPFIKTSSVWGVIYAAIKKMLGK